jgi:hypothetical protein
MADKGDVITWDRMKTNGKLTFSSSEVRDRIIENFADCVKIDSEYLLLCSIIGREWSEPIDEGIRTRIIHDIVKPFVLMNGLDSVDLMFACKGTGDLALMINIDAVRVILSICKYYV